MVKTGSLQLNHPRAPAQKSGGGVYWYLPFRIFYRFVYFYSKELVTLCCKYIVNLAARNEMVHE